MNLHFITKMMKTRVKALITTPSSNLAVVAQLTLFLKMFREYYNFSILKAHSYS